MRAIRSNTNSYANCNANSHTDRSPEIDSNAEASAHACTAPEPRRYIYSDAYTNTYFHTNTDAYTDSDSLPGSRLYFEHLQLQCFGRRYLR